MITYKMNLLSDKIFIDNIEISCEEAYDMTDFVAYNRGESGYIPGDAHDEAVEDGIWTDGDFFDITNVSEGESIGRDKNSTDTDEPEDWDDHGGVDADGLTQGYQNIPEFSDLITPLTVSTLVFVMYVRRKKVRKVKKKLKNAM